MATGGFSGMSSDAKALIVAMELLRVQVQDNALAVAANTMRFAPTAGDSPPSANVPSAFDRPQAVVVMGPNPLPVTIAGGKGPPGAPRAPRRPAPSGTPGLAGIAAMFGLVVAKFAAVAGPLAIIATVVSSATSGFQTLQSAVKLLAGTIAPVLLPVVLMLATTFVAFSDVLMEVGLPVMETFFSVVLDTLIPAIEWMVEQFEWAAKGIIEFIDSLDFLSDSTVAASEEIFGRGDKKTRSRVDGAMRDVLTSFRMSIGPKATMSGLDEVGRAAQMAALQQDPLEARLMRDQLRVLEKIESAVSKRREADRVYDPR